MQIPLCTYRNVSYTRKELLKRQEQENRLMEKYGLGYSGLVKKSIDTLDQLTAVSELT